MVRLAKHEVTIEQLLTMSAQQLADASLQEMRQKQYTAAVEDVQRVSTEEELEAKRRAVMAGQSESWRDRGSTSEEVPSSVATNQSKPVKEIHRTASTESTGSEMEMLDAASQGVLNPEFNMSKDEEAMSSMDGTTSRSLQIEQRVLASQGKNSLKTESVRPAKRPLDADAITRLTTTSNRPQKLAKLSETADDHASNGGKDSSETITPSPKVTRTPSLESPRTKAPSLLEVIKSNFSKSQDPEEQSSTTASNATPTSTASMPETLKETTASKVSQMPAGLKPSNVPPPSKSSTDSKSHHHHHPSTKVYEPSASYLPLMRLINAEGNETISVNRVKDISIRTTAMTNDKRVQGCIKGAVNIDGRTKIPELQRFIGEILDQKRKIVASVVFLAFDIHPGDGYHKFCTEFTRDQRASISNVTDTVQLYVIPPELKDAIPILRSVTLDLKDLPSNQGVLYGLIVAKEPGPSSFVNKPHAILGFGKCSR